MTQSWKAAAITGALVLAGSTAVVQTTDNHHQSSQPAWTSTWIAPVAHGDLAGSTNVGFNDQSVRLIVHTTISGSNVRIKLTNQDGDQPVTVGHATVAMPDTSTPSLTDEVPSSVRQLTFNSRPSIVMNKGGEVLSDPVDFKVGSQQDLVVTIYFPTPTGPTTFHSTSMQNNFVGATDLTGDTAGTGFTITRDCCWFFLAGVDVLRTQHTGSVLVLGDSLGEGNGSTLNANTRWPNLLFARLAKADGNKAPAVLNASLAGNRLNHEGTEPGAGGFPGYPELGDNALARLDEDVFSHQGVQTVITDLGVNDIWMSDDSASAIITSLLQINTQLKEHGYQSLVATIGPFEHMGGAGVWTPEKEKTRQAVNAYLRSSKLFDGVIDFDKVLRDPADPAELLPSLDSGDHIHPNDAGNQLMANLVSLNTLTR
jgi:lysophospholipase L1-like esterase